MKNVNGDSAERKTTISLLYFGTGIYLLIFSCHGMKKCDNCTVRMNIDLDERLQKERVEGRILKRKKLVFLRLPKWKFCSKKLDWLIIIIIIIIIIILFYFIFFKFRCCRSLLAWCCVRIYLSQVYEVCFYLNIFLLALLSFGFTSLAILLLYF